MMGNHEKAVSEPKFTGLANAIMEYETARSNCYRIDGEIIGTGASDFTQGNVSYALDYQGKSFELIDVPGIEGEESRFTSLVQEAVAKAHLVFYVNGTNKKPEKATAEKIRSYLRRGSSVCPLVNVRGGADSYEFEEDRKSLCQSGADVILQQTEAVLASVLGQNVLLPGHCVQGLIAFCSLAYDSSSKGTTIHPSRDSDLVRQQHNYLNHFEDFEAMYQFCQIDSVAEVLKGKASTFKEDIVESNKAKVRELLAENLLVLTETFESHKTFVAKMVPEFDKCRASIEDAIASFERLATSSRRNIYNELFNKLIERSDSIVSDKFGEADGIKRGIEAAFDQLSEQAQSSLAADLKTNLDGLDTRLNESVIRLLEDVERVGFEQKLNARKSGNWKFQDSASLGWNLGLGDFGSFMFQVGSYAATGALIGGSFVPALGHSIGGAIGAALGTIVALINLVMTKAQRIRKSQAEVRKKIEEVRDKKLAEIAPEIKSLMNSIRKGVDEGVFRQVDLLEEGLSTPLAIIERQIVMLSQLKNQIERMPYGSTKAV